MNRLTVLFLLITLVYTSNGQGTKKEKIKIENKAMVTADSCKRWGLEPVNFKVEYPESYIAEYNPAAGLYLQLTKVQGDTVIQQIVFGRAVGLTPESLRSDLYGADSVTKVAFSSIGQKYTTDFIGVEEFLGQDVYLSRATIDLTNVPSEGRIGNGEYSTLLTCLFSRKTPGQGIMLSVISSLKEEIDKKTKLGLENKEILNSLRVE